MYKIYADDTLIYDSTIIDYRIGKGAITLETNKSGSFVFSVYPDHFYYDSFVKLKTIITVYKSDKIVFRGRILNDVTDYWNNKVITCEGELGFLMDSIIRPFDFSGAPEDLFKKFINEHNSQVDDFKKFKIGKITVVDSNNYIARSNSEYETASSNLSSRLVEPIGGYIHVTHGERDDDPTPTINYLSDFTSVSNQTVEFGSNLKNYTKTIKAEEIATAIIPLGAQIDDGNENTENSRLTITSVNDGKDYIYNAEAVALYGWVFKVVTWDDVTDVNNLKRKAEEHLKNVVNQNITIELNAIDLHLLDRSIESFRVGDYIKVSSKPHNYEATMLCNKQTIDLLKPDNDTITLGYTYASFTESSNKSQNKTLEIVNSKINQQGKTYADQNAQLTALMAQSLGLFQTIETVANGSNIYYLHDATTLEKSKTIWKMTAGAFAVSTDGGATWNAGFDAEGNELVNILSSIGINFDWAQGGTLKLGGVDNISGVMEVYDGKGNLVCTITKDGLYTTMANIKGDIDATNFLAKYSVNLYDESRDNFIRALYIVNDGDDISKVHVNGGAVGYVEIDGGIRTPFIWTNQFFGSDENGDDISITLKQIRDKASLGTRVYFSGVHLGGSEAIPYIFTGDNNTNIYFRYADAEGNNAYTNVRALVGKESVEYGSNVNGEYYKFSNGTLICTKKHRVANTGITTAQGSAFGSGVIDSGSWAHEFKDKPRLLGCTFESDSTSPSAMIDGIFNIDKALSGEYYLSKYTSATVNGYIHISAIGRWK